MKLWRAFRILSIVWASLSFCLKPALAQEGNPSQPKPAARTYNPLILTESEQDQTLNQNGLEGLQPDIRPLTGIQIPTLGSQQFRHSYWVPGFQYGNLIQSVSLAASKPSLGWSSDNYLAANLSLLSTWSRSQLAVNYTGGGFFSTDETLGNGQFHELGIIQAFDWQRWHLQFLDQFSYLPEALFGFGGAIRLGVPGIGTNLAPTLPGLGADFVPNQSIFSSTGTRYSNASATEATYALTSRSSITLAGSYGFLRFIEPGNIDSNQVVANIGYDHMLTRSSTVGLFYRFAGYHYDGNAQAIGTQTINFAYGRKITGRLALQLSGGPEIASYRIALNGNTGQVLPYGSASLTYGGPLGQVSLGYTHRVSGGGGVLVGSNTNELTMAVNRQVGRSWTVMGNGGYAQNHSLPALSSSTTTSFGSWVATGGLMHPFGPNASMSLGYSALVQTSSQVCTGVCSTNFTQHRISLGFQWNTRPFVIR